MTISRCFELSKSVGRSRDASSFVFEISKFDVVSPSLDIIVHMEDLRYYRLSERVFVRFPSRSFRISAKCIEERIYDGAKRVDYFYGIVLIIVGPYITIFEFIDEVEVDLVAAVVMTKRRNYSRNVTATTNTRLIMSVNSNIIINFNYFFRIESETDTYQESTQKTLW